MFGGFFQDCRIMEKRSIAEQQSGKRDWEKETVPGPLRLG